MYAETEFIDIVVFNRDSRFNLGAWLGLLTV